ncbi:dephospho-CoA kinase domain-containing protein, partial [Haematococcus lacustris]
MKIVGLTGGIASGKSTATQRLRHAGIIVIDCDVIARECTLKGRWGFRQVVTAFGHGILDASGGIDRDKLGSMVFKDSSLRRKLNHATHLPVCCNLALQLTWHWLCCRRLVVLDMPLLF